NEACEKSVGAEPASYASGVSAGASRANDPLHPHDRPASPLQHNFCSVTGNDIDAVTAGPDLPFPPKKRHPRCDAAVTRAGVAQAAHGCAAAASADTDVCPSGAPLPPGALRPIRSDAPPGRSLKAATCGPPCEPLRKVAHHRTPAAAAWRARTAVVASRRTRGGGLELRRRLAAPAP